MFEEALDDLALFEMQAKGQVDEKRLALARAGRAEHERRRLAALGLPPLYLNPTYR